MNINAKMKLIDSKAKMASNQQVYWNNPEEVAAIVVKKEDYQWMHDTIKQLQESLNQQSVKHANALECVVKLEKENKKLQEESQNRLESIMHGDEENLLLRKRIAELEKTIEIKQDWGCGLVEEVLKLEDKIAELEKERREITAAHEAFLKDLQKAYCLSEVEPSYHFYFDKPIHLAEQVRLAKLSAGVDGE